MDILRKHYEYLGAPEIEPVTAENGIVFLQFPALRETGLVAHGFSTRLGGVSEGPFATLNFALRKGDPYENVAENYRRMARALGVAEDSFVVSQQTHTTNIRNVTRADLGKGFYREQDYTDIDGLMTDEPGITLVTMYADCIPLWLLDPRRKVIALSHSGWRGTVGRMGAVTVGKLHADYGCEPGDLVACVGPGICRDCYEVSGDVAQAFREAFPPGQADAVVRHRRDDKYDVDLWLANRFVLENAGVRPENIHISDICTRCNPELLFSHRIMGNRRGNLAAFLALK